MQKHESPLVYATSLSSETPLYTLASTDSQGFTWNQDLFASQYQQNCNVVFDAHEDSFEHLNELLQKDDKDGLENYITRSSVPHRISDKHGWSLKANQSYNSRTANNVYNNMGNHTVDIIEVNEDTDELTRHLMSLIK